MSTKTSFFGSGGSANGMNEAGEIVGYDNGTVAFVYDPSFGMLTLGAGQGWGVDPQRAVVVGRNSSQFATAWMRQGTSASCVGQTLPQPPTAVGGNAASAARDVLGTLLIGG